MHASATSTHELFRVLPHFKKKRESNVARRLFETKKQTALAKIGVEARSISLYRSWEGNKIWMCDFLIDFWNARGSIIKFVARK